MRYAGRSLEVGPDIKEDRHAATRLSPFYGSYAATAIKSVLFVLRPGSCVSGIYYTTATTINVTRRTKAATAMDRLLSDRR